MGWGRAEDAAQGPLEAGAEADAGQQGAGEEDRHGQQGQAEDQDERAGDEAGHAEGHHAAGVLVTGEDARHGADTGDGGDDETAHDVVAEPEDAGDHGGPEPETQTPEAPAAEEAGQVSGEGAARGRGQLDDGSQRAQGAGRATDDVRGDRHRDEGEEEQPARTR